MLLQSSHQDVMRAWRRADREKFWRCLRKCSRVSPDFLAWGWVEPSPTRTGNTEAHEQTGDRVGGVG